jgi:DNA-binding PadR family transcriptional regulator
MTRPDSEAAAAFLPLSPATFHILLALAGEEHHGYAISQDVEARTAGAVRLGPATLYRTLQRMVEDGLIAESRSRRGRVLDERRRYYRITALGTAAARAEAARLADLVRLARARGLPPLPAQP